MPDSAWSPLITQATDGFTRHFDTTPDGVWSAPGRANLIGEHTDYNGGFVLPFAIDRRTIAAVRLNGTDTCRVASALYEAPVEAPLGDLDGLPQWATYVLGVASILTHDHPDTSPRGFDAFITSDVPLGSGLSSSAALESAIAVALNYLWELDLDRTTLAQVGQRTENTIVGAPTGIMDQSASMKGRKDAVIFLDCRSLETEVVPLGFEPAGLTLLIIDTKERHSHASNAYGARRASCETAARILGVSLLRDADLDQLSAARDRLDDESFRRARHVITEDARVLETVALLRAGTPEQIGPLLTASHVSLRDDFEVTTDRLNTAVEAALAAGALGARMTGGGFGGCAIALTTVENACAVEDAVTAAFSQRGYDAPFVFVGVPSDGAGRDL